MSEHLNLKYYRGDEPDNLCFYRIPKVLFTKACFEEVSTDAKVLYGILLDYASMSRENRWLDEKSRVYIYYSVQRVCAYMGCKKDKAMKLLAELEDFGLIERVKRGQGKSDIIYVKSFEVPEDAEDREEIRSLKKKTDKNQEVVEKTDRSEKPTTSVEDNPVGKTEWSEIPTTFDDEKVVEKIEWSEKPTTSYGEKPVEKTDRSEIPTSCGRKNRLLEVGNSDPNNNEYNYTEKNNDSDPIYLSYGGRVCLKEKVAQKERLMEKKDRTDETKALMALVKRNIEYDEHMRSDDYGDRELYDEMYQLICETVCVKRETVSIEGQEFPQEIVKSRFLKLNSNHLEYVRDCMKKTTTKIGNIKRYLLTALYNAPATMNHYYQQEVQHDLYGSDGFFDSNAAEKLKAKYERVVV